MLHTTSESWPNSTQSIFLWFLWILSFKMIFSNTHKLYEVYKDTPYSQMWPPKLSWIGNPLVNNVAGNSKGHAHLWKSFYFPTFLCTIREKIKDFMFQKVITECVCLIGTQHLSFSYLVSRVESIFTSLLCVH